MNVRELIAELSKLDPELPVVMSQEDEPPGQREAEEVWVTDLCRNRRYSEDLGIYYSSEEFLYCDPCRPVALLG